MSGRDYAGSLRHGRRKEPGRCISIVPIHAWEIAVMLVTHEPVPVHHAPNNYRVVEAINQPWNCLRAKCVAPYEEGEWDMRSADRCDRRFHPDSIGKSRVLIRARRNDQLINLSKLSEFLPEVQPRPRPIHRPDPSLSNANTLLEKGRNVGLKWKLV